MKRNPKKPDTAPKKEDSIAKNEDELQEHKLNEVTGGRKAGGHQAASGTDFLRFKFGTVF
jgi:hypothetical protein